VAVQIKVLPEVAEREIGHIDWQPIAELAKPRELTLWAVHTQEA
jgi:hypothetical protein